MHQHNDKPVIFLAFANDRDDSLRYLRNLPDEARRLREVLEPAEKAGLCEVVVRSNCTAGDIFKVFQDPQYRNLIAIFHYGGHANGYELLLESASGQTVAANAGGFAAFLGQQQGMQLVFLNGCSTREQTQGLLDANMPSVISTSRSIDDKVATDFAFHFYQGLAGGATIQTAYKEAEAAVQTSKGDNTREAYVEDPDGAQDQAETGRWPWDLNLSAGAESADQWNLPQAVGDPLFGLPPLPEQDLPETPYRYLDWFTRKDAEVFFGRGHQIRELYDRLTAPQSAPILLFYGQSGVGKSSILDAGLIPRLERDCEVRYLRRSSSGLLETLQSVFGNQSAELSLDAAWRDREEETGKPLIVFLDQVEEIFTRPTAGLPDEVDQFIQALKVIFSDPARRPKGKLVLGFRKEWLAELETHLASHELPRSKVFLQPLDRRGVIEVVRGPTESKRLHKQYGLCVGAELPEIIADDLTEDLDSAIAPTLQILLTKLWTKAKKKNYEQPEFTQELYQRLKRDGILLGNFLDQQIAAFREKYPEVVDSGLLLDIIAMHTTALGTAGHCSKKELEQQYAHIGASMTALVQQCQDLHLLTVAAGTNKESDKTTRLAHDTLAPLVRERYDKSDKPGQRTRRILDNRSKDWQDDKEGTPLDEADLEVLKLGLNGTHTLNEAEIRLVEASEGQHRKQLRQRRNRKWASVLGVVVVAVAGAFGWYQSTVAEKLGRVSVARQLAIESALEDDSGRSKDSLLLAIQSLQATRIDDVFVAEAEDSVYQVIDSLSSSTGEVNVRLWPFHVEESAEGGTTKLPFALALSNDSHQILVAGAGSLGEIIPFNWGFENTLEYIANNDDLDGLKVYTHGTSWNNWQDGSTLAAAFSSDGQWMAIGGVGGLRLYYAPPSFDNHRTAIDPERVVTAVSFSPDGTLYAWGNDVGQVWLASPDTPENDPRLVTKFEDAISSLSFSSNGQSLAVADVLGSVQFWSTADNENQHKALVQDFGHLYSVAFSADGRWFATGGSAGLRLFNASNLDANPLILLGRDEVITSLALSKSGRWLASGSDDGTLRVWDLNISKPEARLLVGHSRLISSLSFSIGGNWLASASYDGSVRLWPLKMDQLITSACQMIPQIFDVAEFHASLSIYKRYDLQNRDLLTDACREPVRKLAIELARTAHDNDARFSEAVAAFSQAAMLKQAVSTPTGDKELAAASIIEARRFKREAILQIASTFAKKGWREAAIEILEEALETDPEFDLIPETTIQDTDPVAALKILYPKDNG